MARKSKQEAADLRALSDGDLGKELEEAYRQMFTVRLQLSTRQLPNTSLPSKVRQKIARIKTIQHERAIAAAAQGETES
jgi:large subunit ribosomal protein L29